MPRAYVIAAAVITAAWIAHAAALGPIALRAKATHLIVLEEWERLFSIADSPRAHSWRVEPVCATPRTLAGACQVYSLAPEN